MFTVGPVQENCFIFRRDGSDRALIVDPGEEADKLLRAIDALGVTLDGILITHTHFDHVGAVAPVAKATGAEVWVPVIEKPVLADIMSYVPWPEFGPFESWDAEHTVAGGERLELAGFEIDVIFTPGHSPGPRDLLDPGRAGAVLRRRALPGLGRPRRPARRRLADAARVDPHPGRLAARTDDRRPPRPHGDHHARRGARDQPLPRRAGPIGMAGGKIQAPRGTFDVLPEDGRRRASCCGVPRSELFGAAGYGPVETPIFESTELFARGVGETTDIVQKEMFTFEDQGGRSLTLRPEGTAGVCRAYLEHGMHKLPQPVKLWYWGPFFRHEAPQAGRYRQFNQVGVEAIGSLDPSLDAEVILLLAEPARARRRARLAAAAVEPRHARDAPRLLGRAARLPARARESSCPRTCAPASTPTRCARSTPTTRARRAVMRDAPKLLDRLAPEDAEHFAAVRALLDAAGQDYDVDPTLVRGIDYYTRTVFEFTSDALGAQSGVGGGGRYDGLVEQLGGPATPGVGFAAGIERILLVSELAAGEEAPDVFISYTSSDSGEAFRLALELRQRGVSTQFEQAGRSLKGQLKQADRVGAGWVLLIDEGLQLRDMRTGEQREIGSVDEAVRAVNGS